jgi:hypothetical protein
LIIIKYGCKGTTIFVIRKKKVVKITKNSEFRINLNNYIMKNAVTQRVMQVLESKNITPNALADKLGMYQQTISKQLKEDGSGVSLTTIVGMLELFPDLSAEWLLRGEGDMKKGACMRWAFVSRTFAA